MVNDPVYNASCQMMRYAVTLGGNDEHMLFSVVWHLYSHPSHMVTSTAGQRCDS